jgi:hypothetical protein
VRGLTPSARLIPALLIAGCAHAPPVAGGPEVEIALDEGRASEQPLTPPQPFEMLLRIDAKMPVYRLRRMRFLLAQPGHIVFTVYACTVDNTPGAVLASFDRTYGPELTSAAGDGKWIVEDLSRVPAQRGPIFVGVYSPEKHSDPRLWASSDDTGQVVQRELDPAQPFTRVPRTPKLRVAVAPGE